MNKLIRHRFWILLALVPPLVVFGYYSANGAIKQATTARESALDTSFNGIPKSPGPNETYFKADKGGLEVFNKQLRTAVDIEMVRVWAQQVPRMTWPPEMVDNGYVPDTYRGEFTRDAVSIYKDGYEKQLRNLWLSLEPLRPGPSGSVTGKVRYDRAQLPQYYFGPLSVPSEKIWNAQEDIWLLQLLFDAIRNTNRPADNAAKAPVRWLTSLSLMGGNGQSTVRSGGGPAGGRPAGFGVGAGEKGGGGNFIEDDDYSGSMPLRGGGGGQADVAFNASEEFGDPTKRTSGPGRAPGAPAGMGGGRGNFIEDDDYAGSVPLAAAGRGMMDENLLRYIDEDKNKNAKFQERGFYMSVLIDQNKIADFLVELANSDWPIQIVRFNVGPNPHAGMRGMGGAAGGMYSASGRGNRQADSDGPSFRGGGRGIGSASTMSSMLSAMEDEDGDMMAPGFSNPLLQGGMGQAGGGIGPASILTSDQIGSLFSHPDLVEMHLCGKITMYKPPSQELLTSVQAAAAAGNADAREVVELMGLPVTELAVGAAPAEGDAAAAGADESAESSDDSAAGDASETPPADAAPAADEAATTPTAEEAATTEEPAAEAAAEG